MSYDPLGRLYEVATASATTRFAYDGDRLIAEYNGSGALLRRYVHGAGIDEPLVWYEGGSVSAGNRRYLHANHQGSIVALTEASGITLQVSAYDAYGVTGAGNTTRFQYTGQAAIPELGLLYYKARFYNPSIARFMQTDPIGYDDDFNLYAYVNNDPLNHTDPTGQNAVTKFIKQTIEHRGNVIEAAIDVADTAVTVFAPSSTPLDRLVAVAELVSPVAPSDIKGAKNALQAIKERFGGRKGGIDTRAQNQAIGDRIEANGGEVTGGFGGKETQFGSGKGSRFSDGSARDANGNDFQVQTVDTDAAGNLTSRETAAARDIAERGQQPVVCVAKTCN